MEAWLKFCTAQEKELGKEIADKWLKPLKVVHYDACNLYLEAKDAFQALWFEEHIRPKIKSSLFNNNHHPIKVHLTVAEESTLSTKKKRTEKKVEPQPLFLSDSLDPFATFDNFITSEPNRIPLQIIKELPNEIESPFNPIYFYGPEGVGKTHLLMSLAAAYKEKNIRFLYIRTETFTEHVVNAIRNGTMGEFRKSYRHVDALLMDDIHVLARRSATQEELFHTFNALHTARKQIILTGNVTPEKLEDIEPRLVSRFEWGIALALSKLPIEEHKNLLTKRLQALNFQLNEDVQSFHLDTFKSSTKSLMRSIDALSLRADKSPLTVEKVKFLLKDLIEEENSQALSPTKIIHSLASFYGLTSDDIIGKSQTHDCSNARQIAMFLCRRELKLPYQAIGRIFSRDHSTVMTSIKAIQQKLDAQDQDLAEAIKKTIVS